MPVSQTDGYFENPWYGLLEEPLLFRLALKWNLKKKKVFLFQFQDKNQRKFSRKTWWKEQPFIFPIVLKDHIFQTSVLFACYRNL